MWLLNATTRKLHYFNSEEEVWGGYVILSHTWGDDEVSFDDIQTPDAASKQGYLKIEYTCAQAVRDGFAYAWIDTCCIDKRSSAELSEAINSMFRWYSEARTCYAYLSDVDVRNMGDMMKHEQLRVSRWFSRGWTLQELIAPRRVRFYDKQWLLIGSKAQLIPILNEITSIDEQVLESRSALRLTSVAKRMSWAAERSTSRVEDEAYSLLGLFGVNMPMLYGEGRTAFQRLQEEIIRTATVVDHSILAWTPPPQHLRYQLPWISSEADGVLSPSPAGFRLAHEIVNWHLPTTEMFELSPRGLKLTAWITKHTSGSSGYNEAYDFAALSCRYQQQPSTRLGLRLLKRPRIEDFDPTGLYDHLRAGEDTYDRECLFEDFRDHLESLDELTFIANASCVKATLMLARQPFIFPGHGQRLQVAVLFARVRSYSGNQYENQMLQLTPDTEASGLVGHVVVETEEPGNFYPYTTITMVQIRVVQTSNKARPP